MRFYAPADPCTGDAPGPHTKFRQPARHVLAVFVFIAAVAAVPARAQTVRPSAAPPPAPAEAASSPTGQEAAQRIEVTGGRGDDDAQRRRSTAAKIVIGREEIDKFGDATVGEVLRRLPGVTSPGAPGRGGPPRMRGLGNGYTQLLIDGQRVPPGFSLESLAPDQIERIEILRAPTAETGARAIAGTINIVMREGYKKRVNDLRLGFALENGQATPGASWTHNDNAGNLTYNLSGSFFRPRRGGTSRIDTLATRDTTGDIVHDQTEAQRSQERRQGLHVVARLQWRLGDAGDMVVLTPSLFASRGRTERDITFARRVVDPTEDGSDDADRAAVRGSARSTSLRVNGLWRQRIGASRLELNAGVGQFESSTASLRTEFAAGAMAPSRTVDDRTSVRDRSANVTAKLSTLLGGGAGEHSLVVGAEAEALRRDEARHTLQNGLPALTEFGDDVAASSTRLAAYAQDEWAVSPNWALHAGLRWEGIATRGTAAAGAAPENRSSVWTPLVHVLFKPDPKTRDQIRLSLTRSYRAPALAALIARPSLNATDPAPGPNTPATADSAGNPGLRPELATGVDLAFERYLDGGGVLSANLFRRRIENLMRRVVARETVSWATEPRFVARQQNIGSAITQGLELEAKFRLDQVLAGSLPIEMRSNLSFYRSRVDGIAGPDNRLDGQARATANAGADYRLRSLPLTLGGNVNWVPGYRTQLADRQDVTVGTKRVFDAFALWTFGPAAGLRLLASNLGPQDHVAANGFDATDLRTVATTTTASYTNWQLRLELKL